VYDPVGGDLFEEALHCTAWLGRLLIVGFASGRIQPSRPTCRCSYKRYDLRACASTSGATEPGTPASRTTRTCWPAYEQGKLRLELSASYRLEQAVEAMSAIEERKTVGKQVFILE